MNKVKKKPALSAEIGKSAYVKPTMQIYEMEVEQCIMGNSGNDFEDGGYYSQALFPNNNL